MSEMDELVDLLNSKVKILDVLKESHPTNILEKEVFSQSGIQPVEFYKTHCVFQKSTSLVPELYLRADTNSFRCFDCGNLGGIVTFSKLIKGDDYVDFILSKLGYEISPVMIEKYSSLFDKLEYDDLAGDIEFEYADIAGKAQMPDGTWQDW